MKTLLLIAAAFSIVAGWLMPLIYAPATPWVWGAAGVFVVLTVARAIYNALKPKSGLNAPKSNGPAAVLLLLGAAAAASCQRGPSREQLAETRAAAAADTSWATVTERVDGWDVTSAK